MVKVNVGDKVTLTSKRPESWNYKGEMDHLLGKTVTVKTILSYDLFDIEEEGRWLFSTKDIAEVNPKVGDIVHTMLAFKVFRNFGEYMDICDSEGNCIKAPTKSLSISTTNKKENMKAMKDAVLTVAKQLAKANNTVTTLEIKTELRRDYPYYFWTQQAVSDYMSQLAGDGIFTYTDNGTYRTYSLVKSGKGVAPTAGTGTTSVSIMKVAGTIPTKAGNRRRTPKATISRSVVFTYADSPAFESVTINGTIVTKNHIKSQKKSPTGYLTPTKIQKVEAITVGGKTYIVK